MFEVNSFLAGLIDLFAIAGGGGSSGGGGGGGGFSGGGSSSGSGGGDGDFNPWVFLVIAIIFISVWILAFVGTRKAAKLLKERQEKMRAALAVAAAADTIWDPDSIEAHAKETFVRYQKDWSAFNLDSMKKYMTPDYYQHNLLMMGALKLHARQNDVQHPLVSSAEIFEFEDSPNDADDTTTVKLTVHVRDVLHDTAENKQLFAQLLTATEYYTFIRSDSTWKFAGIDQATADPMKRNVPLEAFAKKNGYF